MKNYCFILFAFFLSSCLAKNDIPESVIPMNEMRKLVWDMMRADSYVSDFMLIDSTKTKKQESLELYEKIFSLHKVDKEKFQKSLAFYQSRPDLLKTITDSLRVDEKNVMENQNKVKKPILDTSVNKMKLNKNLVQ